MLTVRTKPWSPRVANFPGIIKLLSSLADSHWGANVPMQTATTHPIIIVIVLLVENLIYREINCSNFSLCALAYDFARCLTSCFNHLFFLLVSDVNILWWPKNDVTAG
jgi:hypothetical protein